MKHKHLRIMALILVASSTLAAADSDEILILSFF